MTLELLKNDKKDYAVRKLIAWNKMIQDNMRPKKWMKPNKNGTAVNFEFIEGLEEFDCALNEFREYLSEITDLFDLGVE
jgi:hypothetical protein